MRSLSDLTIQSHFANPSMIDTIIITTIGWGSTLRILEKVKKIFEFSISRSLFVERQSPEEGGESYPKGDRGKMPTGILCLVIFGFSPQRKTEDTYTRF